MVKYIVHCTIYNTTNYNSPKQLAILYNVQYSKSRPTQTHPPHDTCHVLSSGPPPHPHPGLAPRGGGGKTTATWEKETPHDKQLLLKIYFIMINFHIFNSQMSLNRLIGTPPLLPLGVKSEYWSRGQTKVIFAKFYFHFLLSKAVRNAQYL